MSEVYWKRPEVKAKNKERMAKEYHTPEGLNYAKQHAKSLTVRYSRGRYNANKRKKVFTLSLDEYVMLLSNPCLYCNKDISGETGVGLDRINNDKGYEAGNVNPCCAKCNRIRSKSMGAEEFAKQTILNKRRVE